MMKRQMGRGKISFTALILLGSVTIAPAASRTVEGTWAILWIDCQHDSISNEDTNDLITVEFYANDEFIGSKTQVPTCSGEFLFSTETHDDKAKEVDEIQVRAHGDDALYIDRAWYRTDSSFGGTSFNKTRYTWGSDNGGGYCVSTDTTDAQDNSWSTYVFPESTCRPCLRLIVKADGGYWNGGCNKSP